MKDFFQQLKWQFVLLQKNNIIGISLAITLFYGAVLLAIRGLENMDKVLTFIILTDPATIGFFFIGLIISIEYKQQVLSALFVAPINLHAYLISRIVAISVVGWLCAFALSLLVLGFTFPLLHFSLGVLSICVLIALLGVILISFTYEFLKFALYSVPAFLFFAIFPLINYLGLLNIGTYKYMFLIQGGLDLILHAFTKNLLTSEILLAYAMNILWIGLLYILAFRVFKTKVIHKLM